MPRYALDHLLWACPDLDQGSAGIADTLGIAPSPGGVHRGGGTRNTLLSLGSRRYLEVIAPDPAQPPAGTPAEWMGKLARPGLVTWAVACPEPEALLPVIGRLSLRTKGILAMSRKTPQGGELRWRVLRLSGHGLGPAVPFFIDWLDSPHPAEALPPGATLARFAIEHPRPDALQDLFASLGVEAPIRSGPAIALSAMVKCPKGEVALASAAPLPAAWRDA